MRNLKKLFAVVMVVAMLASIMVPALAADVQYETEAEMLKDLGLFLGTNNGFELEAELTREQALALMIRVMGLEEEVKAMTQPEVAEQMAKVVDPETVTDWAKPYVAYAIKNGLTDGIDAKIKPNVKFAGQLTITGKEFINFMLKGMGYDMTGKWDDVLTFAAETGMISAGDAVKFGSITVMKRDFAVAIMASALNGMTAYGVTLAQYLVDQGAVSEDKMVEYGFITPTVAPTEAPEEVIIEAYTDNLLQIYVEFSVPVDKESAETEGNYSIDKLDIADAKLLDDGQTVVLTLDYDDARGQQDVVDLTIDGVKDVEGNKIAKTEVEDIEFFDTTIPTVVDASIIGKDTIKVVFSEPMKGTAPDAKGVSRLDKADFVVNKGKSYVREVRLQNNYTEALVELYSPLKEGEITLQVKSGSEDFAGFGVVSKTITLEVVPDEEAPVVIGYEKAKRTEVTLIWSEDIEFNKNFNFTVLKDRENFYHTNSKNPVRPETKNEDGSVKDYAVKIDGNKMTLYFENDTKLPNGTAYVYVMKDAVRDYWDNANAQQMIKVEVEVDSTPPAVDKIEVTDEDVIKITFTEELKSDTATKKDNYTILDADGEEVKNIIKKIEYSSKKVTITFKEDLSGDYSIVIKNIEDLEGNKMSAETVAFTVGDKTAPDADKFEATLYNAGRVDQMVKVNFKDVMATEGNYAVTDVEKYVIVDVNGDEIVKLEKIKGVEIVVVDSGKAIEIYVPSSQDVRDNKNAKAKEDYINLDGSEYLRIARVADAAGNKMTVMVKDIDIVPSTNITVKSAKAVARDTIEVTLSDELDVFDAADFLLAKVASDPADSDLYDIAGVDTKLDKDGNTVVVFTLDDDNLLDYDVNETGATPIYVHVIATVNIDNNPGYDVTRSENKYGDTIALGSKKVDDKIKPELYDDGDKSTDYAKKDGEITHVKDYLVFESTVVNSVYYFDATIYFSEEITVMKDDTSLAGNDFNITLNGSKLVNGKDYYVVDYGKVGSTKVGFVTIRFEGKNIEETISGQKVVTGKKFEGDLSIGLIDKPQYIMDPRENVISTFDAIDLDNLEVVLKY